MPHINVAAKKYLALINYYLFIFKLNNNTNIYYFMFYKINIIIR